jgi:hypothetical protein
MSLKKRGKTWHTHFFVDGQRYRQSLATTDWREAQAREKTLIALAAQGKLGSSHNDFGKLSFSEAAETYFMGRRLELSESSQKKERQLLVKPREFFRTTRLTKIVVEDIFKFREWRTSSGVGPAAINMEVGVMDTGYDTTSDTTSVEGNGQQPEVIEMNGRLVGTRTPDLHRVKVAL